MYALLALAAILPPVELRHLGEVVALWTRAHDAASWRAAAEQLDAHADSLDLAIAAVYAWRAADDDPPKPSFDAKLAVKPLTDRDVHLLHAIDVALPLAFDRTWLLFNRGLVYYERDHVDDAVVTFQAIVDSSPAHVMAEYAANLWLDSLNRAQRYEELEDAVARLRVDRTLLAHHPDLAHVFAQIHGPGEKRWIRGSRSANRSGARSAERDERRRSDSLCPRQAPARSRRRASRAAESPTAGEARAERAKRTRRCEEHGARRVPEVGLVVPAASAGAQPPAR